MRSSTRCGGSIAYSAMKRKRTAKLKCLNRTGPIAMVDDSDFDIKIARRMHQRSRLPNPFLAFPSGLAFLAYLEEVAAQRSPLPAMVLMDVNMPELSGFDTIERARRVEAFKIVPFIVMLTNSDNPADIETAFRVGADGYQVKHSDVAPYVAFFDALASEEETDAEAPDPLI